MQRTTTLPTTDANRRKCAGCGLVNFSVNQTCRRCGAPLAAPQEIAEALPVEPQARKSLSRRLLWIAGVTVALIFLWSRSLLLTSEPIDANQRQLVLQAIRLIERAGF